MEDIKTFYPKNREEWRRWLEKNHLKKEKIGLILYKKHTGKPTLNHKISMEEAICFGWIDTTLKKLDDERYMITYVRRTDKSRWSNNTLSYAKKLIEEKKMSAHGLKRYKEGLQRPVIDFILPKDHKSEDLYKELDKNKIAKENFEKLAPSYKRNYVRWIERAKRAETRKKRILETVNRLKENKKLFV